MGTVACLPGRATRGAGGLLLWAPAVSCAAGRTEGPRSVWGREPGVPWMGRGASPRVAVGPASLVWAGAAP
jgi:hypothetical protein